MDQKHSYTHPSGEAGHTSPWEDRDSLFRKESLILKTRAGIPFLFNFPSVVILSWALESPPSLSSTLSSLVSFRALCPTEYLLYLSTSLPPLPHSLIFLSPPCFFSPAHAPPSYPSFSFLPSSSPLIHFPRQLSPKSRHTAYCQLASPAIPACRSF